MVRAYKDIVMCHGFPYTQRSVHFECDECETVCYPSSCTPTEWLYRVNGQELCWECFLDEVGAEIVKE